MSLLTQIPEGTLIAWDTSPWIFVFEGAPAYRAILQPLVDERISVGKNRIGSSVLALGEALVRPLKLGRADLADKYRSTFGDARRVEMWSIDESLVESAARLRAAHGLKLLDAIHVASAIENGAACFITNDKVFRRVTAIPVLILDDFLPGATDL